MKIEKNKIELRLEKKRKIISFFLTIIIHFIFILLLLISGAFKIEKKEDKIITVQLYDKVIEEFNQMEESKKEKLIKQAKKRYENIKKKEQSKENIKKDLEKKEQVEEKKEKIIENQNSEYESYKKRVEEEKKRTEEEFLKSNNSKSENMDDNIDDIFNYKIDEGYSNKKKGEGDTNLDNKGNIKWNKGKPRELIQKGEIKAPQEIIEKGLKVSLTIQFVVNQKGFIEKVDILESTGNIFWDNEIIDQFKKGYIFKESDTNSIGILEIVINY